jgi:hypothetical protein
MRFRGRTVAITAALTIAIAPARAAAAPTVVVPPNGTQPTTQRAAAAPSSGGSARYADPLQALGAASPTCRVEIGAQAAHNCRSSGAVEHRYALSSYGFDVQVGFSLTHMERSFLGALQDVAALVWMALVYAVKGVLLLLEWAFSFDLLGSAMADARRTLAYLHDQVIGQPWFLAALSVAGLWGIWRGFVQRQTTQTIVGLITSILLMVGGLVILGRPDDTVGRASQLANEASLGVLSAATGHDIDRPTRSLADSMIGVFNAIVRDPWCALEFGSVKYCDAPAPHSGHLTNADVWLQYPAGSDQRTALFHLLKGEPEGGNTSVVQDVTDPVLSAVGLGGGKSPSVPDDVKRMVAKNPDRGSLQDSGGTVPRFALLALIAIGMAGAIAFLGLLGVRLLLAAVLALLLLLFAPAVLLAPAFGEGGRATFVAWAQRLLGALVAKLIYALFLAVTLAAAATISRLDVGWFATWLLQIAFWWGVLLKRRDLIGFVSAGTTTRTGRGTLSGGLGQAYYAAQLGRTVRAGAARMTSPIGRAGGAVARGATTRRAAQSGATAGLAGAHLDTQAAKALGAEHAAAHRMLDERRVLEREARAIDRRLAGYDEAHAATRAMRTMAPTPSEEQAALLARRREIGERLNAPAMRSAGQVAAHGARTTARTGSPVAPNDLADYRRVRARDLAANLPTDHERNLRAAGIEPERYQQADPDERATLRRRVDAHLERERALLAAAGELDEPVASPRELRLDPRALRRRTRAEREQLRAERIQRKTRSPR